jgi:hypothetical protein
MCSVLRETKATLERDNMVLQQRCDSLSSSLAETRETYSKQIADAAADMAELRSQIKIKAFELGQLGATFEVFCTLVCRAIFRML